MLFEPCPNDREAAKDWLDNRAAAIEAGFVTEADLPKIPKA